MTNHTACNMARRRPAVIAAALAAGVAAWLTSVSPARAQVFDVESDGSDGALTVAADQGVILFDPSDSARWGRVLDPDGDGVYHFTTITIAAGSTLKLRGDKVNKPVLFLASGDVVIGGNIDLDGQVGQLTTELVLRRVLAIPGSGGYAGGVGGLLGGVGSSPGEGPGGGSGGVSSGTGDSCVPTAICGKGGTFTGNRYLVPLVGGSGGEGTRWLLSTSYYMSGGAGGGALLLASSTSILMNGNVWARGGNGGYAGGGSGGSIRLVAPVLSGSGRLDVSGGGQPGVPPATFGGPGLIRLEGFAISTSFGFAPSSSVVTQGSPIDVATLKPSGSLRVTAIAGIAIPMYPSGSFTVPDVAINSAEPVDVDIQATGIPPGTTVTLRVYPDTPEDLTVITLPEVTAVLNGSLELSIATVRFTFPYGFSRGYVRATWTQ